MGELAMTGYLVDLARERHNPRLDPQRGIAASLAPDTRILSLRGALPLGADAVSTWPVGDRASRIPPPSMAKKFTESQQNTQ